MLRLLNHAPSKSVPHQQHFSTHLLTNKSIVPVSPTFPSSFSLSTLHKLPVLDQGELGSCVANSYSAIIASIRGVQNSRLYYYFNARVGTGESPVTDSGLDLLQAYPIFQAFGDVMETSWNYDVAKFSIIPPYNITYKIAKPSLVTCLPLHQTNADIQNALFSGHFVMVGISVFSSFMTATVAATGLIPIPLKAELNEGGHCIHIVGWLYIHGTLYYIIRNSWGTSWGNNGSATYNPNYTNRNDGGFGYIPASYILDPINSYELLSVM